VVCKAGWVECETDTEIRQMATVGCLSVNTSVLRLITVAHLLLSEIKSLKSNVKVQARQKLVG
jgi:hypothetical protein